MEGDNAALLTSDWIPFRTIETILRNSIISDIIAVPTPALVYVSSTATIGDTLLILESNAVSSAPLFSNNSFYDIINLSDILNFLLKYIHDLGLIMDMEDYKLNWQNYNLNLSQISMGGTPFLYCNIILCLESRDVIFPTAKFSDKIQNQIPQLAMYRHMPIHEEEKKLTYILTQSMVIKWLARHIQHFDPKLLKATCFELKLGTQGFDSIIKARPYHPAIYCCHLLSRKDFNSLAIVNSQDELIASLSVNDTKILSDFSKLSQPIKECNVEYIRYPPITVTHFTTFEVVLLKLAATGVHQLWVVDSLKRPVGVISMTDILNFMDGRVRNDNMDDLEDAIYGNQYTGIGGVSSIWT